MSSSISKKYVKLTDIEQVLHRPAMWIGSVDNVLEDTYLYENDQIIKKEVEYNAGIIKLFDEILMNAFDETIRDVKYKTTSIKVSIEGNEISVTNNGPGIPIINHDIHKTLIPEMLFGELRTSSNYDDTESKRYTAGTNGVGASLVNIFSKEFSIEIIDEINKKMLKSTWKNNMSEKTSSKITPCKKKGCVTVKFLIDFDRFKLSGLTEDLKKIIKKRTYDLAACTPKTVNVYYNDEKLKIKDFKLYIPLYYQELSDTLSVSTDISDSSNSSSSNYLAYEECDNWAVGVKFGTENISFVNGICTSSNGKHVQHVLNIIVKEFQKKLEKKKIKLTNKLIESRISIFVKVLLNKPEFNSQTKEMLTSKIKDNEKFKPSDKFLKSLFKTGIYKELIELSKFKEEQKIKKSDGKIKSRVRIKNLDDAQYAGTKQSAKCKLFLTEGLSAKTFVTAGIGKIGREYFGSFPLKGKLLNVRDQSLTKIEKNEEITNLKEILGLKHGYKYSSLSELRYGGIIILVDQDLDGFHIRGLILNFIQHFWKELLDLGFVCSFATPIVKCFKGKKVLNFYTLTEYDNWKNKNNETGWKHKYYKGLGTNTSSDAKEIFTTFHEKLVTFTTNNNTTKDINLGFNKKLTNERKEWLQNYNNQEIISQLDSKIQVSDIIHKELKHFSYYDVQRSIPNLIDGFKPTHRKILYTCLNYLKNNSEMKVAQLGAKVSEKTHYHHGEMSVCGTIVKMAQTYVGSNNLNLLYPNGAFGTRLTGGKDSASDRYIFTYLNPFVYKLFRSEDNILLKYLEDDGVQIEPEYYYPILPTILINGTLGIGTGYSSNVLSHKVEDIVKYFINRIDKEKENKKVNKVKIIPSYRFYKGIIEKSTDNNTYISKGVYKFEGNNMIITELPIGTWTTEYKEFLESLEITDKSNNSQCIKEVISNHTDTKIHFTLKFDKENLIKIKKENIYKLFKLEKPLNENNMYLFNKECQIRKFDSINDILDYFYKIRLEKYQERKDKLSVILLKEINILKNKVRFIQYVNDKKIKILHVSDTELNNQLEKYKFDKKLHSDGNETFNYLIDMSIKSLTNEKAKSLINQYENKEDEYKKLIETSIYDLWKKEINEFLEEYTKSENEIYKNEYS